MHHGYRRFQGTVRITELAYNGQLQVEGVINGVVQGAGGRVNVVNQPFTQSAVLTGTQAGTAAAIQATCPILDLDIGPIFLNLLGLVIDLDAINLDIFAQPGPGALLGNLLCALVGLLDGINLNGLVQQVLQAIANLLNEINTILAGTLIPVG